MTPRTALSRRTALAATVLVPAGLVGCDIDPPRRDAPTGEATTSTDADAALVAAVIAAIVEAEGVVSGARAAVPAAAPTLDALAADHARHRGLLASAAPDVAAQAAPETGVPGRPPAALAAVRRAERRLRAVVERSVGQAASGDLARVLAVLLGSLTQHAAALDAATPTGAPR